MVNKGFANLTVQNNFLTEDRELRLRRYKIACILAFVGTFSGISLDFIIYPKLFYELFLVRITELIFVCILFALSFRNFSKKHIAVLTILLTLSVNLSIVVMVYLSEGILSPYYAGLNLVILAAGVLLPWTLLETVFVSLSTLILYIGFCVLHSFQTNVEAQWGILFNNSFFIFLTAVISSTASYFNTRARINDFSLRNELDLRNKELEEMDQLKTQFFANVSHELRTPLTLILLPLQELLQSPEQLKKKTTELLKTAENNTLRMLKLVNDLLEVTKLEKNQTKLVFEPVEINNFLAAMMDSMQLKAKQKGLKLVKHLAKHPLVIEADSYALERILLNLLGNSIKFTSEGDSITATSREIDGQAVIEISDSGIGIDADNLPYIFDRFHQVDNFMSQQQHGTGLGLTLVKEFTEKLRGHVSAKSQLGEGTSIKLTFPVSDKKYTESEIEKMPVQGDLLETYYRQAEYSLPVDTPAREPEKESTASSKDKPVILIVDDEPEMRNYLANMFREDYRIINAHDGLEGLELANKHLPSLVLLDMMMPKMTGDEVCAQLKKDKKTESIKIIILTAGMDEAKKIDVLKLGADDYVTKPFNRTEVQTRVRNLIQTALLEEDLRQNALTLKQTLNELKETQIQLVQSEKINALGNLAAGLLHEVNNPLNYAMTALSVAQQDPSIRENKDLKETFADIREGMHRIQLIVKDLHNFAHPSDMDKQKTFSFSNALESALRFTAHEHSDFIIKRNLASDDIVMGSEGHIIQVLVNLLTNSFKAIEALNGKRKGEINIESKINSGRLHVNFRDNGIGMTEEIMADIFNPFFTTMDVGQGIGLGLSISYTIIENHGGSLEVRSQQGEWSELSFDLPLTS